MSKKDVNSNKKKVVKEFTKTPKTRKKLPYIIGIIIVFIISFSYTFDSKLDMNGDNAYYYMLAKSIAGGHGYKDIGNIDMPATNIFPPGYPLLMSPIMLVTDSIFPQKIMNGLFLLFSVILLFLWIVKLGKSENLAFVVSVIILLNATLLYFSTIMMSELPFIFFSMLSLYMLMSINYDKPFFKDKYFYLLIIFATYSTLIRSQGIALIPAVIICFLFAKKWKHCLGFIGGFIICSIPWTIRNSIAGIGGNRYMQQILVANHLRPDEGTVTMEEFIKRGFDTVGMLISKAVPNVVMPYKEIDYSVAATFGDWMYGIILLSIIGIGFWQFKQYKWFLFAYILAVGAILFTWSAPSGARYITTLLPFLEMGVVIGLFTIISWIFVKMKWKMKFSPLILLVLCFFSFPQVKERRLISQYPFPPNMKNYIAIAEQMKREGLKDKVVSSRKPSLFYVFSNTHVCGYLYTADRKALIEGLVNDRADYVVLEQLGYSSTGLYLYPAIQNNPELFELISHIPNPDTYLLRFDREKAIEKIEKDEIK